MTNPTLVDDLLLGLDPVTFAHSVGFNAHPWQAQVLRSQEPRLLLNCSRQSGKSSTVALLAMHTALYSPGSLILMVSPTQRQSGELFRKALAAYRKLGRPVDAQSESTLQLELENGSRLIALPGREDTIRSYSGVNLLLIDEATHVATESYLDVRPMLAASQGRLLALSTPYGTRGWWYEAWRDTGKEAEPWERYQVKADECTHIPADFLRQGRLAMGSWWLD